MEQDIIDKPAYTEQEVNPPIYSKKAVWVFAVLFSTLFGGVLLMQNLLDIGKKRVAYIVLAISVAYTIFCVVILNSIETRSSTLSYVFGFIGGGFLSEYYFRKYFKDEAQYPKKKLWKPAIIGIILIAIILLCVIFGDEIDAALYE